MKIVDFVRPEMVLPEIQGRKKADVIRELALHMAQTHPEISAPALIKVLLEREQLASTAIGEEVAIPHGKLDSVARLVACVARSRTGIDFDSMDGRPTHIFFVLVAPEHSTGIHLKALARISRLFKDADFRARLLAAPDAAAMFQVISQEDTKY